MIVSEEIGDAGVYYAFRDKKTKLYLGYDGFDTDFAKGISPFIHEYQLVSEFNKRLLTKTNLEIIDLLTIQTMGSKEWQQLGGVNAIDIVRLGIQVDGTIFTPTQLLDLFMNTEQELDFDTTEWEDAEDA